MNKLFNKKGVGWLPDDIASIGFALLLIIIAFILFSKVNELVARPTQLQAQELHQTYEQQRLLQTMLHTPITLAQEEKTIGEFLADYVLTDYLLQSDSRNQTLKARKKFLEEHLLENTIDLLLLYYQPVEGSPKYKIRLVSSSTQQDVYIHYSARTVRSIKEPILATAYIPLPPSFFIHYPDYIIIFEYYKTKPFVMPTLEYSN
jgi:hypothetical protein